MGAREWTSLAVCAVLGLCHYLALPASRRLEGRGAAAASFGGGAAAAYVFLHLLAELELGHPILGERIHLIVLAGFVLLFAIDTALEADQAKAHGARLPLRLGLACTYNLLLAYTMAEQLPMTPVSAVAYAGALGLHVLTQDLGLIETFGASFRRFGPLLLTMAVAGGWLLSLITEPPAAALDVLTAFLAGFIIYRVFAEELPGRTRVRVGWFALGVLVYTLLDVIGGR